MQEQQQFTRLKTIQSDNSNLLKVTQRLEALRDQHALVTEQLRELHNDAPTVHKDQKIDWRSLEDQVARLRNEVEGFKQTFASPLDSTNFVFDSDVTFNFFMLDI